MPLIVSLVGIHQKEAMSIYKVSSITGHQFSRVDFHGGQVCLIGSNFLLIASGTIRSSV